MKKLLKTTTHYEPRLLEFPDDPENSHWTSPASEDDIDEGICSTPEEALKLGLEYCSDDEVESGALVVVKVEVTYLRPSKKDIKEAEEAICFEEGHS